MRRHLLAPLTLILLLLTACERTPESAQVATPPAAPAARLGVEGSRFVVTLADGSQLSGSELAGATVQFAQDDGGLLPLRLRSIVEDPEQAGLWRHEMEVPDGEGGWQPLCEPDIEGATWGLPVELPEGHPGREARITLTCASGAVVKCARFGYAPWGSGPEGESLLELHAACIHMVRADYCGDGEPWTRDGTAIDIYDDLGIQVSDSVAAAGFAFEAGWTPQGAACVAQTRWPELIDRPTLIERCPKVDAAVVCDESSARALGARLFNRSLVR